MSNKIFKSVFFTSVAVLAIGLLMIFNVLVTYFEAQVFLELESEAEYIAYGIQQDEKKFLESFSSAKKRITLVAPDGTVIADTRAAAESLENHSDREEIKSAIEVGHGKSARYSDTLTEKNLYYAIRLENGNILRVSTTQSSVLVIILGLMHPIIWIVVIALGVSLFLSYKVSGSIVRPINALDLDSPEDNEAYEELAPLLRKITAQRKTIQRQIKEAEKSREEFRLICENMNEGFLVIDKEERVLSYNSAAKSLLGADGEATDSVITFNRTKNFREAVSKALAGERAECTLAEGEATYNLIANPVYGENEIIGAVIVIIDVTEAAKREQLRHEFTANVSHELKTPLTSISGFAEMMKAGGMSEETVVDFSSSIYKEAQRLIGLVSDIIKISELDGGAANAENRPVELLELSREVVMRLKPVADKKSISLSVTGESAHIMGSEKIIDEMVYNLCDNAVKYGRQNGRAVISITRQPDKVLLTVSDNGIGIPKSEQARVFERFYRVDKSRSKAAGGTGLGLAIVKHGAMYHNAKITLESTLGEGTSITLAFDA